LEIDVTTLRENKSFNISLKVRDLGKLIKYFDEINKCMFEKMCAALRIEQDALDEVLGATLDNKSVINVIYKEKNQEGKNESNAIYRCPKGTYLLKTYSDNKFVTIVHGDAQGILKEILNIED